MSSIESPAAKETAAERIARIRALKASAVEHGEKGRAAGVESRAAGDDARELFAAAELARRAENLQLKNLEEESKKAYAAATRR